MTKAMLAASVPAMALAMVAAMPAAAQTASAVDNGDIVVTAQKREQRLLDVPVSISAVLGRATMSVAQLLQLQSGSVLDLDRKVGEAIDIYVNNRLVARGEVVIVDDRLGVTMTEIIKDGDTQG